MQMENFWPAADAFIHPSTVQQITDGNARCARVAVCDKDGIPQRVFCQGQEAHFFYEFEILRDIGVPSGGVELRDVRGQVIHGKNTFQFGITEPEVVQVGERLRYHQVLHLDLSLGDYWFTVGLASTDAANYRDYREKRVHYREFASHVQEHCRAFNVTSLQVQFDTAGQLLHHGVANLPGSCHVSVAAPGRDGAHYTSHYADDPVDSGPPAETAETLPTVFHVTHWKAGSQWLHKILVDCVPERIVTPEVGEVQFLNRSLQQGKIYPTVYVTKQQFESRVLPGTWRRFVIIRDLRDTLVSAYFSFKVSHPVIDPVLEYWRQQLWSLDLEQGLLYLLEEWLPNCAQIQMSWLEASERLLRYEDLLDHDLEILEPILLDECQLPVPRERFREIIRANRFAQITQGRERGREDVTAHERKGIVGDWRIHFTDRVTQAFKIRYGGLLVATGYEEDLAW